MRLRSVCLLPVLCLALSACGNGATSGRRIGDAGQPAPVECAPFARARATHAGRAIRRGTETPPYMAARAEC